ncbi:MAG: GPW/gp25 family protein [Oscillospiraceae bacterium]|nr:GPW/gp25 family protein [Oscillospiraceae bacterium]
MDEHSFLGNGWSFEVMPDPVTGRIRMCGGEDDIAQSVRLILNTRRGERVMRPDFGCRLCDFAFEAFSQSVRSEMIEEIKTALTLHEPRIRDIDVTIEDSAPEGCAVFDISYIVRATNNPYNLVFPFYIEEGGSGL